MSDTPGETGGRRPARRAPRRGGRRGCTAPATTAHGFPRLETQTVEKFGRPMRQFPVAVSSEAMALAWANQEDAPQGATVVVDHEIRASGLHGRLWEMPAVDSLAFRSSCGPSSRSRRPTAPGWWRHGPRPRAPKR